ncbi:serine/threonine protein kinase [Cobetia sp. MC34]|uniref:serine/threonine protein kinase n=1 Tax=Cobetia sp. MC34 TaxID=2785080 RepID=UPI001BC940C2|nr:serine/threonine protein kinase [Cobetia sp. MC34]MBS4152365.1 serine/threonine protein kinase [Cobetia sp. MC34]
MPIDPVSPDDSQSSGTSRELDARSNGNTWSTTSAPEGHGDTRFHPFDALAPDRVVAAVESLGFWLPGEPFALNSYENRVYHLADDDRRRWVAKFYRPERWSRAQILEEHAFLAELDEAGVPGAPAWANEVGETLHRFEGFDFALFPHVVGRAPELESAEHLYQLGELIGRVHAVGRKSAFRERETLSPLRILEESCASVLASDWLSERQRDSYQRVIEALRPLVAEQSWPESALIRTHGDCHIGNMLGRDDSFALVDFDDCLSAPAVQDLWMLLTGQSDPELHMQLSEVLEGYEQHCEFNRSELKWIETLRTLRMVRHSAWVVRRWSDPAFPQAFSHVASLGYWDDHIRSLEQQRVALSAPRWLA